MSNEGLDETGIWASDVPKIDGATSSHSNGPLIRREIAIFDIYG